jgi:hypothetical protein
VLARIIEPVSKLDFLRVLEEAGVPRAPCRTVTRRLRVFAEGSWRQEISAACAAHAGLDPASSSRPTPRRVPRERVLQGAQTGAAQHHRPAHQRKWLPGHGFRMEQGGDQDDAAGQPDG